jgi:type IV secretion system protein VirB11
LIQEGVVTVPRRLIAEAVDLVVFIAGRGTGRRIETIAEVTGLDGNGDYAVREMPGLSYDIRAGGMRMRPLGEGSSPLPAARGGSYAG